MEKLTIEEERTWMDEIDKMNHFQLATLYRFAPPGTPIFCKENLSLYEYFEMKFQGLGGMTPAISRAIGWG